MECEQYGVCWWSSIDILYYDLHDASYTVDIYAKYKKFGQYCACWWPTANLH